MERLNKVVCIIDFEKMWPDLDGPWPVKDEIYTVISVGPCLVKGCNCGHRFYCLKEVENKNGGFNTNYFREVDSNFGVQTCEKIEHEMEQVAVPLVALFCMRLEIHADAIERLKESTHQHFKNLIR